MLTINYYNLGGMSLEQMIGFEMAGLMWGQYLTDDVTINIGVRTSTTMGEYVIGGATPVMYEQHYGIYQEYLQNDITSADDDLAYYYLQDGNTVDLMIDGEIVDGNSQILLTSAQAKALGMDEAFDLDLDEIRDLLSVQQLANKLALDLAAQKQQALEVNLGLLSLSVSWSSEQQQALDTAQQLASELETSLDYVWKKLLTDTAYQQLDRYLQGTLILDANAIQYQDNIKARNIAAKLDQDLQPVRDLATQLSQQLTDSYEAQYLNQQLAVSTVELTVIFEQDKGTWTRDLVDPNAMDGYIQLNDDFVWDYNYLRDAEAPANTLDFLSVALHETGHILGFTSGIDYTLQQETLYSGEKQISNFTPLDLFRFSAESSVADLSGNLFSIDGGQTILAKLAQGIDANGDGYQASHWERRYDPLGVMDPTLWYQERATISGLDVQAMDLLGWDLSDTALAGNLTLDLEQLLLQAKQNLADKLGVNLTWIEEQITGVPNSDTTSTTNTTGSTADTITTLDAFKQWWLDHEGDKNLGNQGQFTQMWKAAYNWYFNGGGGSIELWWQDLYNWWFGDGGSSGDGYWWWFGDGGSSGDGYWWWFGDGGSSGDGYWQTVGNKPWWEEVFFTDTNSSAVIEVVLPGNPNVNTSNNSTSTQVGGVADDIFAGFAGADSINGGDGNDLIDGGDGDDSLSGDAGNDTIFGFNGNDKIYGGTENDLLSGEGGNDAIYGEDGADVIWGGTGNDFLSGGKGRDFLVAGAGDDAVFGGEDDDVLEGGTGKDILVGGDGRDMIAGGSGDDVIYGESHFNPTAITGVNLEYFNTLVNTDITTSRDTSITTDTTSTNIAGGTNNAVLDSEPSSGDDNTNTSQTSTSDSANTPIRLETENMTLGGDYVIEHKSFASGGSLIKIASAGTGNIGTATTTFTGATGFYDVVIGYYDENDGNSEITVKVGGVEVDQWILDQNLGTNLPGSDNFVTRTISSGLTVYSGDVIELQGIADAYEYARIDYIEFVPVEVPEIQLGEHSDILRGGGGNDIIFGDIGNDIIYGEDEFNDSSYVQAPDINGGYTYGHSTYILSSAGTWEEAQAEARSMGGNLVTINDAVEETWLQTTFGTSEWFWIGFTDKDVEGSFQWASGEEITYTNWAPSEPNNTDAYVRMNYNDGSGGLQWGDYYSGASLQGIIEIDWSAGGGNDILVGGADSDTIYGNSGNDVIYGDDAEDTAGNLQGSTDNNPTIPEGAITYNGSAYLLTNSISWSAAQAYAESLGGNLVTINDPAENQWLKDTFGTTEALWIGLSDAQTEGTWKWASGEVPDWVLGADNTGIYTDWAPTQPDNWGENEDYAVLSDIWDPSSDQWSDVYTDSWFRGIVEIKLPTHNIGNDIGGNDILFGNSGHDTIYGGAGNDIISGTDEVAAGYYERDRVTGGAGSDRFILGDSYQAYYATAGNQDYVIIKDFSVLEDVVQLYGVASDYHTQQQGSNLYLFYSDDLVAIFESVSSLNLNSAAFEYV